MQVLLLCIGGVFCLEYLYSLFLYAVWFLKHAPFDLHFTQSFFHRLIFFLSLYIAVVLGVLLFPFVYLSIYNRKLITCAIFIFGAVFIEMAGASLFWHPILNWRGPLIAFAVALLICRFSGLKVFEKRIKDAGPLPGSDNLEDRQPWEGAQTVIAGQAAGEKGLNRILKKTPYSLTLALKVLSGSIVGALYCAILFVVFLVARMTKNDDVLNLPIVILFDPFVWTLAVPIAVLSGLAVFPVVYFCVYNRNFDACAMFILGVTLAEIAVVTLFWRHYGWFGAYVALIAASLFCRFSGLRMFERKDESQPLPG